MKDEEPTLDDLLHDFCGRPRRRRGVINKTLRVFKRTLVTIGFLIYLLPASIKMFWELSKKDET